MKKRICILFVIAALLTACGNGETAETEKTADTAGDTDTETAAETLSARWAVSTMALGQPGPDESPTSWGCMT